MKNLSLGLMAILFLTFSGCKKEDQDTDTPNTSGPYGVWERYGSPGGYHTDLAIGNIPGEASNRVYMCEHPGSPSAGLYKGYISGNTITWDATYGLPDAVFNVLGSGPNRSLYFGVGNVSDAGKYAKGTWTNTCSMGGGGGGGSTGRVSFWNDNSAVGEISVSYASTSGTITSNVHPTACATTGCANFTVNPGTYSYSASATTGETWSGTATATSNGCLLFNLH